VHQRSCSLHRSRARLTPDRARSRIDVPLNKQIPVPVAQRTLLTPADHGLILHDGGRGFVTIAQRVNGSWRERGVRVADLDYFLRHLDPALDSYLSQNRFSRPWRRIAYLVQADALFSDLDYYATEFGHHDPRYLFDFVLRLLDAKIPPPTFATSTGRGLALVWLHTPIPRRALPRWKACQEAICRSLKPLGADPKARDAARVLRLVGTCNSRSGTLVETISGVGEVWDFDTLATEILPVDRDTIRARRRQRVELGGRQAVAPTAFTAATLWASRLDDFQKLITYRHGSLQLPSGERDLLMLLYGVGMSYLVDGPEQLRREMYTLADDICGWPEHETKARLSSVFSRMAAACRGERIEYFGGQRDPRYRYRDATMVEMLGVTDQEMRVLHLRHLVTDDIKREHDRDRKTAERRAAGAIPRGTYLAGSLSRLRPWEHEGLSRRTWERRRNRNTSGISAGVASPSGCMVAEPPLLGGLDRLQAFQEPQQPLRGGEASALRALMRRETRQPELPLGIPLLQIDETELNGWQQGVAPSTIGRVLLRELRDRKLRQRELAEAVALSRPQLTNVLRGRFGTAAATVGALKRVLSAWGLAA
jgi:hypothetical protein